MSNNVHLICGLTGAGKSTYAEQLRLDLTGARFSIDEWNNRLFCVDRSPTADFDWYYERVQRSCALMRATAEHILTTGSPVIFDCGFTNKHERQIFYDWAADQGYTVTLHYLADDPDTRWARVQTRNAERGDTYMLEVTRDMFDFMQSLWEAPDDAEMARANGLWIEN